MGRRRINNAAAFFDGFNAAYASVGKVLQDREMNKIAGAKVEETDTKRAMTPEERQRYDAYNQALADQDAKTFGTPGQEAQRIDATTWRVGNQVFGNEADALQAADAARRHNATPMDKGVVTYPYAPAGVVTQEIDHSPSQAVGEDGVGMLGAITVRPGQVPVGSGPIPQRTPPEMIDQLPAEVTKQPAQRIVPSVAEALHPAKASDYEGAGFDGTVSGGKKYAFLGKDYSTALSEDAQDRARLNAMAGVYAKFGNPVAGVQLRRAAQQGDMEARRMTLEEARAGREADTHTQAMTKGGMDIQAKDLELQKAEEEAVQRGASKKFEAGVAALQAQGKKPTWDDYDRLASEAGLNQETKAGYLTRAYGLDELETKAKIQDRVSLIDEAAQKGLDEVVSVYDNHALFDNGVKGRVVRDPKTGRVAVYDGNALVAQGANDTEVVALIQQRVRDPIAAVNLEYQIKKFQSGLKKDAADIRQSDASAAESYAKAKGGGERVTLTQKANNAEIVAARRKVAGMSAEDIRKKTQQYTDTGRTNEAFDPQLAAAVRKANEHMVGEDPEFDQFNAPRKPTPQPAQPTKSTAQTTHPSAVRQDVSKRFRSDHTMHNYKLGKETDRGVEVLDRAGKLIGYYD